MSVFEQKLAHALQELQAKGLYRKRYIYDQSKKPGLNFSNNNYLGLADDARVQSYFQEGYRRYPAGSGASALLAGYHDIHAEFEAVVAQKLQVESAILFASGYAANLSLMNFLAHLKAPILMDKAMHASVYDGLKLSGQSYKRFLHQDLSNLKKHLSELKTPAFVVTEGLFSMSGQIAPLREMAALCKPQALMIVDEAHSFGVLGPHGMGLVLAEGLTQAEVPLKMVGFGKAAGAQGAVIAGKKLWLEALLQWARPYIYSTALSPAFTYGLLQTIQLVYDSDELRQQLRARIADFQTLIQSSPWQFRVSHSPIQQLQMGCPHLALACSEYLLKAGIDCKPLRQPTVTKQETGLRIILNAQHTTEDLRQLIGTLNQFYAFIHQKNG